jgi:hypothetical protein
MSIIDSKENIRIEEVDQDGEYPTKRTYQNDILIKEEV